MTTIGQVAKEIGISTDTIRLYERYGLIEEPVRAENSYRCYYQKDIQRLKFIKRAKMMGFTLKEIHELLNIQQDSDHTCNDVKKRIANKLKDVLQKISELERLADALSILAHYCDGHEKEQSCPALGVLESMEQLIQERD